MFGPKREEGIAQASLSLWSADLMEESDNELKTLQKESEEEVVIVRLPHSYGIGQTLEEAMRNCLEELGIPRSSKVHMDASKGKGIFIDDAGGIHYKGELEKFPEAVVRSAFESELYERYERAVTDFDDLSRIKGVASEVLRHTQKIHDILGTRFTQ